VSSPETFLILFIAAVFAGFIDAIAGGGGLIALPALLSVGIPPQIALGTNKLQGMFGSATAALYYWRKGLVDLKKARIGIFFTFAGAGIGAWAVQQISGEFLNSAIPILLFIIAVYTIVTPALGRSDAAPRMGFSVFYGVAGIVLGFYDGFFGPGVGSFWAIAFMVLLGYEIQKATGYTKDHFRRRRIDLVSARHRDGMRSGRRSAARSPVRGEKRDRNHPSVVYYGSDGDNTEVII